MLSVCYILRHPEKTPHLGPSSRFWFEIGRIIASEVLRPVAETANGKCVIQTTLHITTEARQQTFVYRFGHGSQD